MSCTDPIAAQKADKKWEYEMTERESTRVAILFVPDRPVTAQLRARPIGRGMTWELDFRSPRVFRLRSALPPRIR